MRRRLASAVLAAVMAIGTAACGAAAVPPAQAGDTTLETAGQGAGQGSNTASNMASEEPKETEAIGSIGETEIQVFIAASLNTVMQKIAEEFSKVHPEIKIVFNADSSGKLLTQIEEGYACDVFFSAAQKQMNALEEDGLLIEGTRANVLNNQLVVVTRKDSRTAVTGLADLDKAESIAMADGSVPAGKYTRQALMNLGILEQSEDAAAYTTEEVSEALGGVEISEQSNVSKVLTAIVEASCEVGTTYYSDIYGYEEELQILEVVPYDLTGNIIYPIAQVVNTEADEAEVQAAAEFVEYVLSDEAAAILQSYYFDTDL
ncbi:MAG: molybdate ABC transporter substrate-binding protein [Lachnospiraceae bacterium]|nr:molybdate ABC transporter substrate-binding protein [Lachnospiraceae bacterium]